MTAFAKWLISFICVFSLFLMYKGYRPEMTMVYPDSCIFTIDSTFSDDLQRQIKVFIDAAYKKNKNLSGLLQSLESEFLQISSIIIDMQNSEAFHFRVQSRQPLFLVDAIVVCTDGTMFDKQNFSMQSIGDLHTISFQGKLDGKTVPLLIDLYAKMPKIILEDFSVRWLDQKKGQQLSLLVDYKSTITQKDVEQCRQIRGQIVEKPCTAKKGKVCKPVASWVCDLRFDHQIVLFSRK